MAVFRREISAKMYGPSVYYFGRFVSNFILQLCYPILLILITFFGLGIKVDAGAFFEMLAYSIQLNLIGVAMGFFVGILIDKAQPALTVN